MTLIARIKSPKPFLIIIVTLIFHVAVSSYILKKSELNRESDEACILRNGIEYYNSLFRNQGPFNIEQLESAFRIKGGTSHPPLYEFMQSISWKILHAVHNIDEDLMVLMTNALFFFILLISIYEIGAMLFSREAGILAAFLVSFYPAVFGHFRTTMTDFPLTCMISLSFYLLLKTGGFKSSLYSALLGMGLGLSQLTKEASILFILIPLFYYLMVSFGGSEKKRVLLNFILTLVFFAIVSGTVYLQKANRHIFDIYAYRSLTEQTNAKSFLYYVKHFSDYMGPFILVVSLPLFLSLLINYNKRNKVLLLWFCIPFLLFSFSSNRTVRFLLPIFPAFSLFTTQELYLNIFFNKARRTYALVLIIVAIFQFILFNSGIMENRYRSYFNTIGIQSVIKEKYREVTDKIIDFLRKNNTENRQDVTFLFYVGKIDWPILNKCAEYDLNYKVKWPTTKWQLVKYPDMEILNANYIIDKNGGDELNGKSIDQEKLRGAFNRNNANFVKASEISIFDGSRIIIYRNIKDSAQQ